MDILFYPGTILLVTGKFIFIKMYCLKKKVTRCMKSGPDISTATVIESFKIKIKKNTNISKNLLQCLKNSVSNGKNEIEQKANEHTLENQLSSKLL